MWEQLAIVLLRVVSWLDDVVLDMTIHYHGIDDIDLDDEPYDIIIMTVHNEPITLGREEGREEHT
jgi:hypothetical protein